MPYAPEDMSFPYAARENERERTRCEFSKLDRLAFAKLLVDEGFPSIYQLKGKLQDEEKKAHITWQPSFRKIKPSVFWVGIKAQ